MFGEERLQNERNEGAKMKVSRLVGKRDYEEDWMETGEEKKSAKERNEDAGEETRSKRKE